MVVKNHLIKYFTDAIQALPKDGTMQAFGSEIEGSAPDIFIDEKTSAGKTHCFAKLKEKIWVLNKNKAGENFMGQGLPLAAGIGALLALSKAADVINITNPAFRFFFVVKGAGYFMRPIDKAIQYVYKRKFIKMPAGQVVSKTGEVLKYLKSFTALKKAAPIIMGEGVKIIGEYFPEGVGFGQKIITSLSKMGETAARGVVWFPKTAFNMGEGVFFANIADYFAGEKIQENFGEYGDVARHAMTMSCFFGREIGDLFLGKSVLAGGQSIGNMSRFLEWAPVKNVIQPYALLAGAAFATQIVDYGVSFAVNGTDMANYSASISFRAFDQYSSPANEFIKLVMGPGFGAHLSSGSGFGFLVDEIQSLWVSLSIMGEDETLAYIRQNIYDEDVEAANNYLDFAKGYFSAVVTDVDNVGDSENTAEIWQKKIEKGFFEKIDTDILKIGAYQGDQKKFFDNLRILLSLITPSSINAKTLFSEKFLNGDPDDPDDYGTPLIKKNKRAEFLSWIGGEAKILNLRKQQFILKLIEADIYRVLGIADEQKIKLLDLGSKYGFVDKIGSDYVIKHDQTYFENIAKVIMNAALTNDPALKKMLYAYSANKAKLFIESLSNGNPDSTCLQKNYYTDLQLFHPSLIIDDPKNESEMLKNFLEAMNGDLPVDPDLKAAMVNISGIWNKIIKKILLSNIQNNIAAKAYNVEHCYAPLYEAVYNKEYNDFNAILGIEKCQCLNSSYLGMLYFINKSKFSDAENYISVNIPSWSGSYSPTKLSKEEFDEYFAEYKDENIKYIPNYLRALQYYSEIGELPSTSSEKTILNTEGQFVSIDEYAEWLSEK